MFFKKKKKGIQAEDKVWISKVAKLKGLRKFINEKNQLGISVLIVHHFDNTQDEVQRLLEQLDVSHQTIGADSMIANPSNVFVINANHLSQLKALPRYLAHGNQLQIVISEHYPAYERDQEVLQEINEYLPNVPICFFTSLDEPFMQIFGSERISGLMQSLGMNENESLAHSLITKSIMKAQQKVEKTVSLYNNTVSQKAWFEQSGVQY